MDVLVAGGGPVGLACAIEARLAGLSVTVVEPRTGPLDKACGEGLMPGAVRALRRLGVTPEGHPLRGVAYLAGRRRVEHRFAAGWGLGVRRTVLHLALAERAATLGARFVTGRVTQVEQDPQLVLAHGIPARWLLACDGLHSGLRGYVASASGRTGGRTSDPTSGRTGSRTGTLPANGRRFGLRRHFAVQPWTDLVEVHWGRHGEAYVTPVGPRCVGVALLGASGRGFAAALAELPDLATRLADAAARSQVRGAGPLRQLSTRRTRGRVLLVGDAAGYVDALTGEGLRVGFAQARAAVAAVLAERPERYERDWRELTRGYRWLTGGLLGVARSPARPVIVPAASRLPGLFGAAVDHLAGSPPRLRLSPG